MLTVYEILSHVDPKAVSPSNFTPLVSVLHSGARRISLLDSPPPGISSTWGTAVPAPRSLSTMQRIALPSATLCTDSLYPPPQPLAPSQAPAGGSPFKTCPESQGRCTRVVPSTRHWPDDRLPNSGHCALINVLQPPCHAVVGSHGPRSQLKHPDLSHTYAIGVFHSVSHSTNTAFKKIISTPKADTFP